MHFAADQRLSPPESLCPSTLARKAGLFIHSVSVVRCFYRGAALDGVGLRRVVLGERGRSEGVLQLEDAVGERGVQVRVRHLLQTEAVKHLVVGIGLEALELVNADLSVVDRDEVHELFVLVNIDVELLDRGRVRVDIFLNGRLRHEETHQGGLSEGHLLKLRLLFSLLLLSLSL